MISPTPIQIRKRSQGFSLVAAVFVLMVLASLGVVIVIVGEVQRATTIAALQGARGYYAAQSGIEWGVRQAFTDRPGTCTGADLAVGTINDFAVTVSCTATLSVQERNLCGASQPLNPPGYNVLTFTSTARFGTDLQQDFVVRSITATVTDGQDPPCI